jgi:hypothetical protein
MGQPEIMLPSHLFLQGLNLRIFKLNDLTALYAGQMVMVATGR